MQKPIIGLIGAIGSGKSLVANELARRGGHVIAGDQLGHEALRQPDIRSRVLDRWGQGIADAQGNIDREKLGAIVFAHGPERKALESIIHPWIEKRIGEEIEAARHDPRVRFVVLDAAILLEAGWNRFCDRLVYVHAPRELRLERVAKQRGWSEQEMDARANAQLPLPEKVSRADAVVTNAGSPDELARQVEVLMQTWGLV